MANAKTPSENASNRALLIASSTYFGNAALAFPKQAAAIVTACSTLPILFAPHSTARTTISSPRKLPSRRAAAGNGGRSVDAAMAGTAQAAIFTEALLEAEHARLAEIKSVTK